MTFNAELWSSHPGLVWSNPHAGDDVRIRAALLRPRFLELLEVVAVLGIVRVEEQWRLLEEEDTPLSRRATPVVQRILGNVRRGMEVALAAERLRRS